MRSRIELLWIQLRRVWRPALTLCAALLCLGACVQWDPATETIVQPGRATAVAPRGLQAADSVRVTRAPTTPARTAQPQSLRRAHSLAARSD
jgi:hypothetical protein